MLTKSKLNCKLYLSKLSINNGINNQIFHFCCLTPRFLHCSLKLALLPWIRWDLFSSWNQDLLKKDFLTVLALLYLIFLLLKALRFGDLLFIWNIYFFEPNLAHSTPFWDIIILESCLWVENLLERQASYLHKTSDMRFYCSHLKILSLSHFG